MRARDQGGCHVGKEGALSDMDHSASHELMRAMDSMMPVAKSDGRTQGKVTKVEPDGTVWVALRDSRGTVEMPCKRSVVAAKPGDTVAVTVRERRAIVESNISSPAATVEQTEGLVKTSAQELAENTNQLFQSAISDAQAAHEAAGRAEKDAQSAADSAANAATSAASAATSAENAERDAERSAVAAELSERKALESNGYALGALNSLATLQDVMGTIGWAADNAAFVEASGEYDPNGRYFVKGGYWLPKTLTQEQYEDGTWYVKGEDGTYSEATGDYDADAAYYTWVAGTFTDTQDPPNLYAVVPESSKADFDAGSYYVMDMRQSMAEYVSKHVVFAYGTLWITPDGVTGEGIAGEGDDPAGRIAIGTEGITLYDGHGRRIARYGSGVDLGAAGDGTQTSIASDVLALLREAVIDGEPGTYPVFQVGTEAGENPFLQFADGKGHDLFTVDSTGKPTFAKPVPIPSGGTNATTVEGARDSLGVPSYTVAGQHWQIGEPDGTHDLWMRVPTPGILPDASTTNTTGRGSLGANSWYFASAYVANYYGTWKGNPLSWSDLDTGVQDFVNNASFSAHARTTDLNPLMNGVKWWGSNCANIPSGESYGIVATFSNGTDPKSTGLWRRQIALSTTGRTYTRQCINCPATTASTSWTSWIRVWDLSSILPVANGGTGLTASPSLLVNLASTSATSVFQALPRPGVTGALGIANGGTGATTAANARSNLGLTRNATEGWSNITVEPYSSTTNASNFGLAKRGGTVQITFWGTVIKSSSSRVEIATIPAGYRPLYTVYDPGSGLIINESGKVLSDKHDGSAMWASCCWTVA